MSYCCRYTVIANAFAAEWRVAYHKCAFFVSLLAISTGFEKRLYAEETEVLPFGGIQVADFFPSKHLAISIILRHVCEDSVSKSLLLSVF